MIERKNRKITPAEIDGLMPGGHGFTLHAVEGRTYILVDVQVISGRTVQLKIRDNSVDEYLITDNGMLFKMLNAYGSPLNMVFKAFNQILNNLDLNIFGVEIVDANYAGDFAERLTSMAEFMDGIKALLKGESCGRRGGRVSAPRGEE